MVLEFCFLLQEKHMFCYSYVTVKKGPFINYMLLYSLTMITVSHSTMLVIILCCEFYKPNYGVDKLVDKPVNHATIVHYCLQSSFVSMT